MENTEQDPEEIPMDQVLAEIRQMLSAPAEAPNNEKNEKSDSESSPSPRVEPVITAPSSPSFSDRPKSTAPDYFLLTPAMRCDLPPDSELSETIQRQTTRVLNKLQQQSATELSPALVDWLNANLPAMIEKVLQNNPNIRQ